jgi:epoxyqueuosine reductase QueG
MITPEIISSTVGSIVERYGRSCGIAWRQPIIAFASAEDPGFSLLKKIVSESHFMPGDILPGAKTIINFFIPFDEGVAQNNREGSLASREWAVCYIETNWLIKLVCDELDSLFRGNGLRAGLIPATRNFDEKLLISNWSHRHAAWIAGLGSFGINNMLITEKGCCGRIGTVVTDWYSDVPNPGAAQKERCLDRRGKKCGQCHKKCPVSAYTGDTFDRQVCYTLCRKNASLHSDLNLATVCGKCLCGLPCSSKSP